MYRFFILFPLIFLLLTGNIAAQNTSLPANAQKALEEYQQQAAQYSQSGNKSQESYYLNKIASLYWDHQLPLQAAEYYKKSLQLNHALGNQNAIAIISNHLGMIYADQKQQEPSLQYFEQSLTARKALGDKTHIVSAIINVAVSLNTKGDYQQAITQLEEGLALAKELQSVKLMRSCYGMISDNYRQLGNNDKAIEYYNYFASLEKKIQEEIIEQREAASQQKVARAQAEKQAKEAELQNTTQELQKIEEISAKRQMQIDLLNKEKELKELALKEQEAQLKIEALVRNSLIGGIFLTALLAFMLFANIRQARRVNRQLSEQKAQIAAQHDELEKAFGALNESNAKVTSSINYAQRIQGAMLQSEEEFHKMFPDSFILFLPRDIVSGDFYWFTETSNVAVSAGRKGGEVDVMEKPGKKQIIAAVDCTGHGVPGALMSMLGYNLLNEIENRGFREADHFLNELHASVRHTLKQEETSNQDGMDAALCVIDPEQKVMEFAGANNPLVYFQNGEMHHIKGTRRPIGGYQPEEIRRFDKHTIDLKEETTVYIFSDGFQDQFGGKDGRKYRSQNLMKLLHEIHARPFAEQKEMLHETYLQWKGEKWEQIDDILIMGFKV